MASNSEWDIDVLSSSSSLHQADVYTFHVVDVVHILRSKNSSIAFDILQF